MGYLINYPGIRKQSRKQTDFRWAMIGGIFILLLAGGIWPEGRRVLAYLLFPGDVTAVLGELEGFAENLKSGIGFPEALEAFCLGIFAG